MWFDGVVMALQIDHQLASSQNDMADDFASAVLRNLGARAKQRHLEQATACSNRHRSRVGGVLRCDQHRLPIVVMSLLSAVAEQTKGLVAKKSI